MSATASTTAAALADRITLSGVKPYDGSYELDIVAAPLTVREWGWIKKHAGYLPVTVGDDTFTDPEFIAVLAVIALRRNGSVETRDVAAVYDRIADAPFGATIRFELGDGDGEGDADPPPRSSNGNESSSGAASTTSSESSDGPQTPTGDPALATSGSAPATSES